jgi:hypothetical protein
LKFTVAVACVGVIPDFEAVTVKAKEVVTAEAAAKVTENLPEASVIACLTKLVTVPELTVGTPVTVTVAPLNGLEY